MNDPVLKALVNRADLYDDIISKLRFETLTRAEQYAQLDRAALAQPVEPVAWAITYRGAITQHFHNRETAGQEFGRMQATYPNDAALRALIPLYAAPQGPNSDAGAK